MAAVPISQIPNAPQGAAPVLQGALPGVSPLQPLNLGGGLDASGLGRTQSLVARGSDSISQSNDALARGIASTKRNLIDPSPFVNAAGAGEFVGKALRHAGAVATNFAEQMMQAKDSMDMMRVDDILQNAADQHKLDIAEQKISPSDWVPTWNKSQPEVMKQIQALGVSPRIQAKVTEGVSRFWGGQTMDFAISATKQSLSDSRDEVKTGVSTDIDRQNYEGAFARIDGAVKGKILSASEGEGLKQEVESKHHDSLVNTAVSADPKSVLDDMETAKETGKSGAFPWLDAAQRIRVESMARTGVRQNLENSYDNADASIQSGEFTTPEQIDEYGKQNEWGLDKIKSYKQALTEVVANTPAGFAKLSESRVQIGTNIAAYDRSTDPKDETYWSLKDQINRTLPQGYREEYLDDLKKKRDEGQKPEDRLRSSFFEQINKMSDMGLLGPTGYEGVGEKKKLTSPQAALDLNTKVLNYQNQVTEILTKNPGMSPEDASKKFKEIFTDTDPAGAASKAFSAKPSPWSGWFTWDRPPASDQVSKALNGQDTSGFIRQKPTPTPTPKPMSGLFNGSGKTMASNDSAGSVPQETIDFIKGQEGFSGNAFSDYAQTSIGYGTRAKSGEKSISKEDADARLKSELATHATNVDKAIAKSGIDLTPNQRAALISFDFNTGSGAHLIETSHSADEIAARLPTWNKVTEDGKKVVNKGLVNRRAAEMQLFNA